MGGPYPVAFLAAERSKNKNSKPKPIDHASVSICQVQNPASAHCALNAMPFSVLHMEALVKWCLIYSEVVYSDAIVQPKKLKFKMLYWFRLYDLRLSLLTTMGDTFYF